MRCLWLLHFVHLLVSNVTYILHVHFRYTSRVNEQVRDLLLEQLAEKYPEESTPVLKREFARSNVFICIHI